MNAPLSGEYAPFFARYIGMVPDNGPIDAMQDQLSILPQRFGFFGESQADFRYAPGKWTVKEVLQHIIDTERVFGYRALSIARGEQQNLPGFDENAYADTCDVAGRSLASLLEEWEAVRKSNLLFFRHISERDAQRIGTSNGHPLSVRALAYIMAGHVLHHLRILEERYHPQ